MLKEKESFRLLYQAIREIADKIGGNQLETNSVSLLLLDFDFEHEVFDELHLAILKYLNTVSIENISHSELLNLIGTDENGTSTQLLIKIFKKT